MHCATQQAALGLACLSSHSPCCKLVLLGPPLHCPALLLCSTAHSPACPQAEKREERRRRGNPDTQTSDARFDEQFGFAHKLYGEAAMPW